MLVDLCLTGFEANAEIVVSNQNQVFLYLYVINITAQFQSDVQDRHSAFHGMIQLSQSHLEYAFSP